MNAEQKPIISTMINTTALALTSYGVLDITQGGFKGYLSVFMGFMLELFKYSGMKYKLW